MGNAVSISICKGPEEQEGKRENLNYNAVITKAPANPTSSSGTGVIVQSCPEPRQGSWAFVCPPVIWATWGQQPHILPKATPDDAAMNIGSQHSGEPGNFYLRRETG